MGIFTARKASNKDAEFWDWIRQNKPEPIVNRDDLHQFNTAANERLREIDEGLCLQVGVNEEKEIEIVISADGIRDLFPTVERVVSAAGPIPGCQPLAFRQRMEVSELTYDGDDFTADDFLIEAYQIDGVIGLNVHVAGLNPENPGTEGNAAFIFLDCMLGEYDVATKIGPIEFYSLADDPAGRGLIPIQELPKVIDEISGQLLT